MDNRMHCLPENCKISPKKQTSVPKERLKVLLDCVLTPLIPLQQITHLLKVHSQALTKANKKLATTVSQPNLMWKKKLITRMEDLHKIQSSATPARPGLPEQQTSTSPLSLLHIFSYLYGSNGTLSSPFWYQGLFLSNSSHFSS